MGVPAFFRWLSRKYPSIVVHCDDGVKGNYDFDNLYLDMNGIIHPCSHPENKPPPADEDEMFLAIFEYVEDILKIVKPKKLLYMAVDGVAPRAKMNQQRSRRFRAAQESYDKLIEIEKVKEALRQSGMEINVKEKEAHFDSNVITPGTQFMINLSDALRAWIDKKLSLDYNDEHGIWPKDLVVILSDATVPGEGEHKIMDYIRKQKSSTNYDPNLSHCLYGADADLIMLGLSTHEPNFTILREEFKPNQPRPCDLCGQLGHDLKVCTGQQKPLEELPVLTPTEFIYIRLNALREYLLRECKKCKISLNFERFIDDYVLLCFFVGNDFLPHLPSLEIRENAIDRLIIIYQYVMENFPVQGDIYLSKDGIINKERVQHVLRELGDVEDDIFKMRQHNELQFKQRNKWRKQQQQAQQNSFRQQQDSKILKPQAISDQKADVMNAQEIRDDGRKIRMNSQNANAAQKLKSMLVQSDGTEASSSSNNGSHKRKHEEIESDSDPEDLVQLHNDGWKERYYQHKFDCDSVEEISRMVSEEYFKGLCWVLLYYYQGCPDWKWFFPFHYAPFASDFKNIEQMNVVFDSEAKPFRPLEQLMSVFPAASSKNLPPTWRELMVNTQSPIIDFYPSTFQIDLNGKKAAWMGVALLPFIDENRLFQTLAKVYSDLSEEEVFRNRLGNHLIFISKAHPMLTPVVQSVVEKGQDEAEDIPLGNSNVRLISGTLKKSALYSDKYQRVLCCEFNDPSYEKGFIFPSKLLEEATIPPSVLKPEDLDRFQNYRPQIGMNRRNDKAYMNNAGHRMVNHYTHQGYNRDNRSNNRYRPYNTNHRQYDDRNNYRNNRSNYGGYNDRNNYQQQYPQRQHQQQYHQQQSYQSNYSNYSYYQQQQPSHGGGGSRGGYQQSYNQQRYNANYYQQPPPQQHGQQQPRNNIPSYYTGDYLSHQNNRGGPPPANTDKRYQNHYRN